MPSLKKIIRWARKNGRIRDGLVLCENCDNPADNVSLKMSWVGCGPCIFGKSDALEPDDFIVVDEREGGFADNH